MSDSVLSTAAPVGINAVHIKRVFFFFFRLFKDFIHLLEHSHVHKLAGGGAEREADSPLSREPYVGLDPRTLRS